MSEAGTMHLYLPDTNRICKSVTPLHPHETRLNLQRKFPYITTERMLSLLSQSRGRTTVLQLIAS